MNDKERAALWVEIEKASKSLVEAASWQDAEDALRHIDHLHTLVEQLIFPKQEN